ncbi:hypothetical protein TPAU25S_01840 [Tsukamurella paurometabola]
MVFQQFNLFPHFTVLQNLTEGPVAAGIPLPTRPPITAASCCTESA